LTGAMAGSNIHAAAAAQLAASATPAQIQVVRFMRAPI
jgi:hypothetical protein